jgi:hypothetical protein
MEDVDRGLSPRVISHRHDLAEAVIAEELVGVISTGIEEERSLPIKVLVWGHGSLALVHNGELVSFSSDPGQATIPPTWTIPPALVAKGAGGIQIRPLISKPEVTWMVWPLGNPSFRPEVLDLPVRAARDLGFAVGTLLVKEGLQSRSDLIVPVDLAARLMVCRLPQSGCQRLPSKVGPCIVWTDEGSRGVLSVTP